MADSCFITNRRDLLIGMGGTVAAGALFGSVLLSPAYAAAFDPAYAAYLHAKRMSEALNRYRGPEDAAHERMIDRYIEAQEQLIATPARSLPAVRGKMERLAFIQNWERDDDCFDAAYGFSILNDLDRMTGIETSRDPGRLS